MDFEQKIAELTALGTRAQATFARRYIMRVGPALCRTIIRYACERLDIINAQLPDTDPGKKKHYERKNISALQS